MSGGPGSFGVWAPFSAVGAVCVGALLWIYMRKRVARENAALVNCWFCNEDCLVNAQHKDSWWCDNCSQYNGFDEAGDYNKALPQLHDSRWNPLRFAARSPAVYHDTDERLAKSSLCSPVPVLCRTCTRKQAVIVQGIAAFEEAVDDPAPFEQQAAAHRSRLEQEHPLCRSCTAAVSRKIREVDRDAKAQWLTEQITHSHSFRDAVRYSHGFAARSLWSLAGMVLLLYVVSLLLLSVDSCVVSACSAVSQHNHTEPEFSGGWVECLHAPTACAISFVHSHRRVCSSWLVQWLHVPREVLWILSLADLMFVAYTTCAVSRHAELADDHHSATQAQCFKWRMFIADRSSSTGGLATRYVSPCWGCGYRLATAAVFVLMSCELMLPLVQVIQRHIIQQLCMSAAFAVAVCHATRVVMVSGCTARTITRHRFVGATLPPANGQQEATKRIPPRTQANGAPPQEQHPGRFGDDLSDSDSDGADGRGPVTVPTLVELSPSRLDMASLLENTDHLDNRLAQISLDDARVPTGARHSWTASTYHTVRACCVRVKSMVVQALATVGASRWTIASAQQRSAVALVACIVTFRLRAVVAHKALDMLHGVVLSVALACQLWDVWGAITDTNNVYRREVTWRSLGVHLVVTSALLWLSWRWFAGADFEESVSDVVLDYLEILRVIFQEHMAEIVLLLLLLLQLRASPVTSPDSHPLDQGGVTDTASGHPNPVRDGDSNANRINGSMSQGFRQVLRFDSDSDDEDYDSD